MSERLIIGGLLAVLLAWILLNPDVISRLPLIYVIAVAPTVVLVSAGSLRVRRKPKVFARRLERILSLEHGDRSDPSVRTEAETLYERLDAAQLPTAIEQSAEFLSAANRAGPHQFACLRLALHHPARDEDPWHSLLRTHWNILRASGLKQWELETLNALVTSAQSE